MFGSAYNFILRNTVFCYFGITLQSNNKSFTHFSHMKRIFSKTLFNPSISGIPCNIKQRCKELITSGKFSFLSHNNRHLFNKLSIPCTALSYCLRKNSCIIGQLSVNTTKIYLNSRYPKPGLTSQISVCCFGKFCYIINIYRLIC